MLCTQDTLGRVEAALGQLRVPPVPGEMDLHALIARALTDAGVEFRHEVRLGPRCRIDFVAGDVGIEVKKGKVLRRALIAQAQKYLACEALGALLLVTGGAAMLPGTLHGKPVRVFGLNRLWGVSLP